MEDYKQKVEIEFQFLDTGGEIWQVMQVLTAVQKGIKMNRFQKNFLKEIMLAID